MFGNGGFAGESLDHPLHVKQTANALRHGFAVTYTNTGHDERNEPLASFAINRQKLIDFAFRSIHQSPFHLRFSLPKAATQTANWKRIERCPSELGL